MGKFDALRKSCAPAGEQNRCEFIFKSGCLVDPSHCESILNLDCRNDFDGDSLYGGNLSEGSRQLLAGKDRGAVEKLVDVLQLTDERGLVTR